jgi:membrane carboxypeptidase/penicillin-binding protein PbpC
LTAAYAAFANGGYRVQPLTIARVEDSRGRILKAGEITPGPRVLDERVAYLVTDILSDNFARAPAFGEGSALRLSRPAAAKTGTTTDWRDNWTVGYTPDLVVGVWVGNADNEPMQYVSGVEGAAPIWHDVMETLLKGQPPREFVEPPGLVRMEVCADSGLPPVAGSGQQEVGNRQQEAVRQLVRCPCTITDLFIEGTQPTATDDWHWRYTLDARNGLLAGTGCPSQLTVQKLYTLYPAEAQEWIIRQDIPQPPGVYSPLCPNSQTAGDVPQTASTSAPYSLLPTPYSLLLTSPDQGGRYRLSSEIPPSMQRLTVAARPVDGVALRQVTLLVDGRPLATLTRPPYQILWPMEIGTHSFSVIGMDTNGNRAEGNSVVIEVVE